MKVALITNGFFVNKKTEEIRMTLIKAFKDKGVSPVVLTNDNCLAGDADKIKELGVKTALFWDKDVTLARSLENCGIRTINTSEAIQICDDKGMTFVISEKFGLPTPKTLIAPFTYSNIGYSNLDFLSTVTAEIDFPIVVKERHGSFGQQVHLAEKMADLIDLVKTIAPRPMIFQEYIECDKSDLRLEVVGNEVVAAVRRRSLNGDFRANATLGGIMTNYVPSRAEVELALAAAKAVGAEIAGVDILPGKQPRLCEVNANAHFKRLMDATKVDVASKIVDYVLSL